MAYGLVLGENEATKAVKDLYKTNGQSTWDQAYQNAQNWRTSELAGIAEQERAGIKLYGESEAREIADVKYDYNQALRDAYAATTKNDAAIMKSNLGQGYKDLYIGENQAALQEAYDSYRKSYLQQKSQIESQTQYGVESILQQGEKAASSVEKTYQEQLDYLNESLAAEGKNVSDATGATFDYLQYLYDSNPELFESFNWSKYKQYFDEETGKLDRSKLITGMSDWTTDEQGNYVPKLNEKAVEFFDQMLNYSGTGIKVGDKEITVPGFGSYLESVNSDLLDWLNAYNPWHSAKNEETGEYEGRTGYQIFKEILGIDPNDNTYAFNERLGALTDKELGAIFKDYKTWDDTTKTDFQAITGVNDAKTKLTDLGNFINELGIDIDGEFSSYLSDVNSYIEKLEKVLSFGGGKSVENAINQELNKIYKDVVDNIVNTVPNVRKEHSKLEFDKNEQTIQQLTDRANGKGFVSDLESNREKLNDVTEFIYQHSFEFGEPRNMLTEKEFYNNNDFREMFDDNYNAYKETFWKYYGGELKLDYTDEDKLTEAEWRAKAYKLPGNTLETNKTEFGKQYPTYTSYLSQYETDKNKSEVYKDYDYKGNTYAFNELTKNGYLPPKNDDFYKLPGNAHVVSSTISNKHYKTIWTWALGTNLDINGEEVELQNYGTEMPLSYQHFVKETVPDGSMFAFEVDGKKQLIIKHHGNVYTLGAVEKKGKAEGQRMYEALWDQVYNEQQKSINNAKAKKSSTTGKKGSDNIGKGR